MSESEETTTKYLEWERFYMKVAPTNERGCRLWTGKTGKGANRGYGAFWAGEAGAKREVMAHRWQYASANGCIPEGMCVLHKCDVRACVNPDHLMLGTRGENLSDMAAKGRASRQHGSASGKAKLTDADVLAIRAVHARGGVTLRSLARVYGVTGVAIGHVVARKSWRHI